MSLSQPFGAGRLLISGTFQEVADYVVPNEACADLQGLKGTLKRYPTVVEFLKKFEAKGLAFSVASPLSSQARIEAVFLEGGRVMACEATIGGTRHLFLGQRLRQSLRASGQSIVRDFGAWCWLALDTRLTPFEYHPVPFKTNELEEFHEAYADYWGLSTDYETARTGLAIYPESEWTGVLVGSLEPATSVREAFRGCGEGTEAPFEEGLDWGALEEADDFMAAWREVPGYGLQVLLTREGYGRLREQDRVVVRATQPAKGPLPTKLSLLWSPREVEP